MTIETTCPDCNGKGWQPSIEGDIWTVDLKCERCNGFGWIEIKFQDEDIHDILFRLVEQKHELIKKYL